MHFILPTHIKRIDSIIGVGTKLKYAEAMYLNLYMILY